MIDPHTFQSAIRAARPGTIIEISIVRVIVPDSASPADVGSGDADLEIEPDIRNDATDPARRTPLERLRALLSGDGETIRKEGEWAAVLCRPNDFPARELERACRAGAIPHRPKGFGKDAGARQVVARDLERYLELRQHVRLGIAPAPDWWDDVVSPRHRSAA